MSHDEPKIESITVEIEGVKLKLKIRKGTIDERAQRRKLIHDDDDLGREKGR